MQSFNYLYVYTKELKCLHYYKNLKAFTFLQIVTPRNRMGNSFSRIKCFDAEEGIVNFHVLQK